MIDYRHHGNHSRHDDLPEPVYVDGTKMELRNKLRAWDSAQLCVI